MISRIKSLTKLLCAASPEASAVVVAAVRGMTGATGVAVGSVVVGVRVVLREAGGVVSCVLRAAVGAAAGVVVRAAAGATGVAVCVGAAGVAVGAPTTRVGVVVHMGVVMVVVVEVDGWVAAARESWCSRMGSRWRNCWNRFRS